LTPNSLLASSIFLNAGQLQRLKVGRNSWRVSYQKTMRCFSNRLLRACWILALFIGGQSSSLASSPTIFFSAAPNFR
jgi:hypothetical protein